MLRLATWKLMDLQFLMELFQYAGIPFQRFREASTRHSSRSPPVRLPVKVNPSCFAVWLESKSQPPVASKYRHCPTYRHDISVRSRRYRKKRADFEPLLHLGSSGVCGVRPNRCLQEPTSLAGWLNACWFMTQLIHRREEFGGASPFLQTLAILQCACRVDKRITLPMGLFMSPTF